MIVFLSLQHEKGQWPSLEQLGVQVAGMPLLPAMAKSLKSRVPRKVEGQLVPLVQNITADNTNLLMYSAMSGLLDKGINEFYSDILIYLESCTIPHTKFLVTNDNKVYQRVARYPELLTIIIIRESAMEATAAYQKKQNKSDLSFLCCTSYAAH